MQFIKFAPNMWLKTKRKQIQMPVSRYYCTQTFRFDLNTNVIKDVIIYKYENSRFFKILNVFAICQFGFWTYLSVFAYTKMRDAPVKRKEVIDLPWWRNINLGENKYKNTLAVCAFVIGFGVLTVSWMYTLRSVKYLILRKGGKHVSLVTYTPLGNSRILNIPLDEVSCQGRRETVGLLPIKLRKTSFYYIVDSQGEFKNPSLFDYTVGLKRNFTRT